MRLLNRIKSQRSANRLTTEPLYIGTGQFDEETHFTLFVDTASSIRGVTCEWLLLEAFILKYPAIIGEDFVLSTLAVDEMILSKLIETGAIILRVVRRVDSRSLEGVAWHRLTLVLVLLPLLVRELYSVTCGTTILSHALPLI